MGDYTLLQVFRAGLKPQLTAETELGPVRMTQRICLPFVRVQPLQRVCKERGSAAGHSHWKKRCWQWRMEWGEVGSGSELSACRKLSQMETDFDGRAKGGASTSAFGPGVRLSSWSSFLGGWRFPAAAGAQDLALGVLRGSRVSSSAVFPLIVS